MSRGRRTFVRLLALTAAAAAAVAVTAVPATAAQPSKTLSVGAAKITNVAVDGAVSTYAFVESGRSVTVGGSYRIGDTGGAVDQIQIGWSGTDSPVGCVYDGEGNSKGTFSVDLGVPPSADSFVIVNFAQDFFCRASGPGWWTSNTGPAIAEVVTVPAATVTVGAATFVNAGVDALGVRGATRGAGALPGLRVTYSIADTGAVSSGIMVGWAGSTAPVACLYQGPSNQKARTVTVNLGVPPKATGANAIVAAYYPACDSSQWKRATKPTLAVVYVDRYL